MPDFSFNLNFDFKKLFRSAMTETFLLLYDDFDELESILNWNGIDYGSEEEESI